MRANVIITSMAAALLGTVAPAFAASGVREDNSNFVVWTFLSVCALILLVQIMPIVFMTFGLVKGAAKGKESLSGNPFRTQD